LASAIILNEDFMKRLFRSRTNKKIAGVCGGIGEFTDTDPTIIRLIVIVLGLVTGLFPFFIGYLIAWWIVPEGPLG
jgi:phage shock protein PspC (stress-responsive transcriptional regulator)